MRRPALTNLDLTASTEPADDTTQEPPTEPRPVSPEGRTLDRWGLPLSGPARQRALAGRPDPALDPEGEAAPATTETEN